jgi:hypothetical protein
MADRPSVLEIGPGVMPDVITGAMFHSIMAWPAKKEAATFRRVVNELAGDAYRQILLTNPDCLTEDKARHPWLAWDQIEHLSRPGKRLAAGHLRKRLGQRMAAARMGIGLAYEELFNQSPAMPEGVTELSIDQLATLVRSDVTIDDPENVEKFAWRPSLPIIHVAMAAQLMLQSGFSDRADLGVDLKDLPFYSRAVKLAELIEPVVLAHPKFNIAPQELTRIVWRD